MKNNYEIIDTVLTLIEEQLYDESLNLESLAASIGYSKYHLHRMFSAVTHYSLHEYIHHRRLNEAGRQLIDSNKTIIEISQEAGYDTQRTFTRAFKAVFKNSPAAFRKQREFMPVQLKVNVYELSNQRERVMDIRIIEHDEMKLVGFTGNTKHGFNAIGRCWHKLHKYKHKIINRAEPDFLIGVNDYSTFEKQEQHPIFKVMAAAETTSFIAVPKGMNHLILPASKYVVFTFHGRNEDSMQPVAEYIYGQWFPNSTLIFNENCCYDFVKYNEQSDDRGESDIEYWVPIL